MHLPMEFVFHLHGCIYDLMNFLRFDVREHSYFSYLLHICSCIFVGLCLQHFHGHQMMLSLPDPLSHIHALTSYLLPHYCRMANVSLSIPMDHLNFSQTLAILFMNYNYPFLLLHPKE